MCMIGAELVCVPCQYGVGIFNSEEAVYIPEKIHDMLYKKYRKDIRKLSFEYGGATCNDCRKTGGNNCKTCKLGNSYVFKDIKVNEWKWIRNNLDKYW